MERICDLCAEHGAVTEVRAAQSTLASIKGAAAAALQPKDAAAMGAKYKVDWKDDESRSMCALCEVPFDKVNRRHHCRFCGDIFCQVCSDHKLVHPETNEPERACTTCVRADQVGHASLLEYRSPRFVLRVAQVLVLFITVILGIVGGAVGCAVVALFGLFAAGAAIALRIYLLRSQLTLDSVFGARGEEGEEGSLQCVSMKDPEYIVLVPLAIDLVLTLASFLTSSLRLAASCDSECSGKVAAGVFLLLASFIQGPSVYFSYLEATGVIAQLCPADKEPHDESEERQLAVATEEANTPRSL